MEQDSRIQHAVEAIGNKLHFVHSSETSPKHNYQFDFAGLYETEFGNDVPVEMKPNILYSVKEFISDHPVAATIAAAAGAIITAAAIERITRNHPPAQHELQVVQ